MKKTKLRKEKRPVSKPGGKRGRMKRVNEIKFLMGRRGLSEVIGTRSSWMGCWILVCRRISTNSPVAFKKTGLSFWGGE